MHRVNTLAIHRIGEQDELIQLNSGGVCPWWPLTCGMAVTRGGQVVKMVYPCNRDGNDGFNKIVKSD